MRWFRRAPEAKDSRAGALIALSHLGRPRWTPRDYASLAEAGFGRNPVAYRCARKRRSPPPWPGPWRWARDGFSRQEPLGFGP